MNQNIIQQSHTLLENLMLRRLVYLVPKTCLVQRKEIAKINKTSVSLLRVCKIIYMSAQTLKLAATLVQNNSSRNQS